MSNLLFGGTRCNFVVKQQTTGTKVSAQIVSIKVIDRRSNGQNRGLAWIYRLPPDKRFEPVYLTVKMGSCSPFNKCCYQPIMTLLWVRRTVVLGCDHASFECIWAVRHTYGIIRHMQGLYEYESTLRETFYHFCLHNYIFLLFSSLFLLLDSWETSFIGDCIITNWTLTCESIKGPFWTMLFFMT